MCSIVPGVDSLRDYVAVVVVVVVVFVVVFVFLITVEEMELRGKTYLYVFPAMILKAVFKKKAFVENRKETFYPEKRQRC